MAPARVRFRIAHPAKPVLLVPTYINGTGPHEFVFDTGASMTVVSADLARKLDIQPGVAKAGMGAGGRLEVSVTRVGSMVLGRVRQEGLAVAVMDLAQLGKALGARLDGIIGHNFVRKFRVTIDYPNGTLTLQIVRKKRRR